MKIPACFIVFAAFLCACGVSRAQVIFGYSGGNLRTDGGIVAGNSFTAFGGQTFNSLGFIDVGNDGIAGSYQVGVWDSAQNLLASTTVTPSSPLINGFRYASIPAVTIPNGATFTIGALLPPSPPDAWVDNTTLLLGAGFGGSGQGKYVTSAVLTFPTNTDSSNYAVANASGVVVPEPASIGALVMGCLLLMRRRA